MKKSSRNSSSDSFPFPSSHKLVLPKSLLSKSYKDVHSTFSFSQEIGRGSFGIVWACENIKTGKKMACKEIPKMNLRSAEEVEEVRREVEIMKHLSGHPNVVSLQDVFEDENSIYLIMELCEGGELFDLIRSVRFFRENIAARIFYDIVQAVHFCHSKGVVHRDLKPENLFLTRKKTEAQRPGDLFDMEVKLGDFGLSLFLAPGAKTSGSAGSKFYESPEHLLGKSYDSKADLWSLGIILYVLLSGRLPFLADSKKGVLSKILQNSLGFYVHPWSNVSENAKSLVKRLLTLEPSSRPSTEEILHDIWLQEQIPDKHLLDQSYLSTSSEKMQFDCNETLFKNSSLLSNALSNANRILSFNRAIVLNTETEISTSGKHNFKRALEESNQINISGSSSADSKAKKKVHRKWISCISSCCGMVRNEFETLESVPYEFEKPKENYDCDSEDESYIHFPRTSRRFTCSYICVKPEVYISSSKIRV